MTPGMEVWVNIWHRLCRGEYVSEAELAEAKRVTGYTPRCMKGWRPGLGFLRGRNIERGLKLTSGTGRPKADTQADEMRLKRIAWAIAVAVARYLGRSDAEAYRIAAEDTRPRLRRTGEPLRKLRADTVEREVAKLSPEDAELVELVTSPDLLRDAAEFEQRQAERHPLLAIPDVTEEQIDLLEDAKRWTREQDALRESLHAAKAQVARIARSVAAYNASLGFWSKEYRRPLPD